MNCKTPDGLTVHELRGVGLVVSASEHNREVARLRSALEKARDGIRDEWARRVSVSTPLRNASIAVDAALANTKARNAPASA